MSLYKPPILFSITYICPEAVPTIHAISKYFRFFLDSGAYTNYYKKAKIAAGKKEVLITIKDYIQFCHKMENDLWAYIMLDEICDPENSMLNLQDMLKDGLKPIPVFVELMKRKELPKLLEVRNNWICVASGSNSTSPKTARLHKTVYAESGFKAKIHALGYGNWPGMKKLPIKTMDSSSWLASIRYGIGQTFDPYKGMISWDASYKSMDKPGATILRHLREMGATLDDIKDPVQRRQLKGHPSLLLALNYQAFMRLSWYVENYYGRVFFPAVSSFSGLLPFQYYSALLASTNWRKMTVNYQTYKWHVEQMHNWEKCTEIIVKNMEKGTFDYEEKVEKPC